ncbi:transposase [Tissierella sp. MB52-C2]|uniref:transposase n=1 Tax=Tissierella sp. MB52-C2 TaxID=3070999 RepID=UPI00280AC485|nr:transposase [Tissierella sp. MB52-C2]WMM27009.1 transposase [Tissierella sp. MB52-C2]
MDKFSLEVAVENVNDAYNRFFKGQNRFPKFKSKHNAKQAYTTKFTNNNIEIVDKFLKLPKLKLVKFNMPNEKHISDKLKKVIRKKSQIKNITISEKAGKYYASLSCEEVIDRVKTLDLDNIDLNKVVGIDLGLMDFATITNGLNLEKIPSPKYLKKSEDKLAKTQRSLSKKKNGSKNFIKAKKKVGKVHEKIANQRKDFAHQLSRKLVNENQVVIVEDLNIKGMVKNRKLAKSISDAGWSRFITFLDYKLKLEGKHLVEVDRWFASSKLYSSCGNKNIMLTLNERAWVCSGCGTHHNRDLNASLNIRKEGLKQLKLVA